MGKDLILSIVGGALVGVSVAVDNELIKTIALILGIHLTISSYRGN